MHDMQQHGFYGAGMLRHLDPVSPEEASNGEEESYDKENVNRVNIPQEPTKKEYEEHMATHWPYRSWCPHCIRGKSSRTAHKSGGQSESTVCLVAIDGPWKRMGQKTPNRACPS